MFYGKYECDIASYVYDNTFHISGSYLATVFSKLENSTYRLFTCFKEKHTKPNEDKFYHLLVPPHTKPNEDKFYHLLVEDKFYHHLPPP